MRPPIAASTSLLALLGASAGMVGCDAPAALGSGSLAPGPASAGEGADLGGGTEHPLAPGLSVRRAGEARGSVEGRDLIPREGEELQWRLLDPQSAPGGQMSGTIGTADFLWRLRPTDRYGATVALDEGAEQTLYLATGEQGEARMTASVSHRDGAVSRFEPPLVMSQPQLAPGRPVEGRASMTVLTLEEPPSQRERGTATRRVAFTGLDVLTTPLGRFECQRVEISFEADLRFASASVHTIRWVLPGVGPVAEDRRERIRVLGLRTRESRRIIVRTTPLEVAAP